MLLKSLAIWELMFSKLYYSMGLIIIGMNNALAKLWRIKLTSVIINTCEPL